MRIRYSLRSSRHSSSAPCAGRAPASAVLRATVATGEPQVLLVVTLSRTTTEPPLMQKPSTFVIDIRVFDSSIHLSREEGWQLRTQLGDRAPFLRNQLMVAHRGGRGDITLSTQQERREVLAALADGEGKEPLTLGLRSLEATLMGLEGKRPKL